MKQAPCRRAIRSDLTTMRAHHHQIPIKVRSRLPKKVAQPASKDIKDFFRGLKGALSKNAWNVRFAACPSKLTKTLFRSLSTTFVWKFGHHHCLEVWTPKFFGSWGCNSKESRMPGLPVGRDCLEVSRAHPGPCHLESEPPSSKHGRIHDAFWPQSSGK